MDIEFRQHGKKWIAEVWENLNEMQNSDTMSEELYQEINEWCIKIFKYNARTAYHIFEFKSKRDLEWFLLKWS